jgi:hypothetical protein
MKTAELRKQYDARIAKVEYEIVIEIHKKLIELFKQMKVVQPKLERSWSGMGSWSISGAYLVESLDIVEVLEDYPDLKLLKESCFYEGNEQEYVVYEGREDGSSANFANYIESVIEGYTSDEFVNVETYFNDACIEFYELYCYIQEINHTTIFDGVNEDGVIVTYGKGSCNQTFTDAKESIQVQMLHKNNVPIVFFDSTRGKYYKYVHI